MSPVGPIRVWQNKGVTKQVVRNRFQINGPRLKSSPVARDCPFDAARAVGTFCRVAETGQATACRIAEGYGQYWVRNLRHAAFM